VRKTRACTMHEILQSRACSSKSEKTRACT